MSARDRWATSLAEWAIPERILADAPANPWTLPLDLFVRRAERAVGQIVSPSARSAAEALRPKGSVLDVGAGGGAASLPFVEIATALTAVDERAEMMSGLAERSTRAGGVQPRLVIGRWPDVAANVDIHDVAVSNHVLYNVPVIEPFLEELTAHARRRVVVEITMRHPTDDMTPLWRQFHGLVRPAQPTADDLLAVLVEMGINAEVTRWVGEPSDMPRADAVVLARQRLCLPATHDSEIEAALRAIGEQPRELVTLAWPGRPRSAA